jgi:hypothetical protein
MLQWIANLSLFNFHPIENFTETPEGKLSQLDFESKV